VLFRPEEVHGTSGTGKILKPLPEGHSHIPDHILGFYPQNDSIPNLHLYGLSAIEARGIDSNRFAGKKPADRQRFKGSLAEPFLLTVDGDPVLGRKVIKRSEGGNEIRIWKKPSRDPGSKKLVQGLSPLLHRHIQFGCNLCVMRCLAGLYHSTHDDMERSFKPARFIHGFTSYSFLEDPSVTSSFVNI